MPSITLVTNVKIDNAKELSLDLARKSAEILNKPIEFVTTSITYNETLTFAGTADPAFDLRIISLDNLSDSQNESYSAQLSKWLKEKLGLDADRGYIWFVDPGRGWLGYKETTVAAILGKN